VIKEAEEEASLPHDLVTRSMNAAGLVSYRYAARRGLSTKLLAVFDLKLVPFRIKKQQQNAIFFSLNK